ncbi:hypothetical protein CLOM_g14442 [Closterium sp. NIES-68]|nr:hypothetical protein CLOM_g14442 [Closterium sp. NIES-68]
MPLVRAGNLGGVGGDMRPELDERAQHGTSFAAHSGEGVGEEAAAMAAVRAASVPISRGMNTPCNSPLGGRAWRTSTSACTRSPSTRQGGRAVVVAHHREAGQVTGGREAGREGEGWGGGRRGGEGEGVLSREGERGRCHGGCGNRTQHTGRAVPGEQSGSRAQGGRAATGTAAASEGRHPRAGSGARGATRGAFGEAVLAEVVSAAPAAVVVDGFMGAERMAHVYSQTLLNIHPCLYDAYGMTVVEAAAFAAPSIIHVGPGGAVGAAELLLPGEQLALPLDLSAALPVVVEGILALLQDRQYLAQVGVAARRRSLEWSEEASARVLSAILRGGPA